MTKWPHDDAASLKAFYGDPSRGEPGQQLVAVVPPFRKTYAGKPDAARSVGVTFRVSRAL